MQAMELLLESYVHELYPSIVDEFSVEKSVKKDINVKVTNNKMSVRNSEVFLLFP